MERIPKETVADIDEAIRKCLVEGMTNLHVDLSPQDYEVLLQIKPGPITTYRGYPLRTAPTYASQVLHKFEDGRLSGYAVTN